VASSSSGDLGYLVDGVACQDCGLPLPAAYVRRVVTDADNAEVVSSVKNGTVNQVICPDCGAAGWISIPFLWIDLAKLRAVFVGGGVWRHDRIAAERDQLLDLALSGTSPDARATVLARLQEVPEYRDLPLVLARTDEEAHGERIGLADFQARQGLPAPQRLERLLADAVRSGAVVLEGFESSAEFCELIRQQWSLLDTADDGLRAQALRQIHARLPPLPPAAAAGGALTAGIAVSDDVHLDIFARMLEADTARQTHELLDDLLQVPDRGAFLTALAPSTTELDALIECAKGRLATVPGGDGHTHTAALAPLVAELEIALARQRNAPTAAPVMAMANDDSEALATIVEDATSLPAQRLTALENLALRALNQRRYHDTVAIARRLMDLARSADDSRLLANGLFFAGSALVALRNPAASLGYLQEAYNLLIAAELDGYSAVTLAHVFEAIGGAYEQLAALPIAAKAYEAAAGLFQQLQRPDGEHANLERLAGICRRLGEHRLAELHFRHALTCVQPDSEAAIRTLCNLGDVLAGLSCRPDTALKLVLRERPRSGEHADTADGRDVEAQALGAGALPQEDQLAFLEGREDFSRGRAIFRVYLNKAGKGESFLYETIVGDEAVRYILDARRAAKVKGFAELELLTYAQLSNLFLRYDMRRAARDSVEIGKRRCDELGREPSVHALISTAVLHEDAAKEACVRRDTGTAHAAWSACIDLCERILQHYTEQADACAHAAGLKALSLEGLGRFDEAAQSYRAAIAMFEGRRRHLEDKMHKLNLQAGSAVLYPRAARNILALRRQRQPECDADSLARQAYALAEAARSRILLDTFGPASCSLPGGGRPDLLRPIAAPELATRLPATTAVVQYSLLPSYCGHNGCWAVFLVLPGGDGTPLLVEHDLEAVFDAVENVNAEIQRIEAALGVPRGPGVQAGEEIVRLLQDHRQLDGLLARLGSLLLPVTFVESIIAHGIERLVFVPEAYLMDVPFAALRVSWPDGTDYVFCGQARTTEVLVTPSASAIVASWHRAQVAPRSGLLCISDPGGDLGDIPDWIRDRFGELWQDAPVVHLAQLNAHRAAVENALGTCDAVIYLGHGFYDMHDPANSGLALHDGLLNVRRLGHPDVAKRFSGCRLFVIMACSGARVDVESEWAAREVQGLAAQLLGCGVDDVIGGLWPLSSGFATDFVDRLFTCLEQGATTSAAFTQALAGIVAAGGVHAHPYLWGGMRLSGGGRTAYQVDG